jgi:sugar lactone lactonase YvrE
VGAAKGGVVLILFLISLSSCLSHPTGQPLAAQEIQALKQQLSRGSLLFEDFEANGIDSRLHDVDLTGIADSGLPVRRDGLHLSFSDSRGFSRVIVGYTLTSAQGHIFLSTNLPEGHFAIFNDALGNWAWENSGKGQTRFDDAGFGAPSAANTGKWIIHEIRIEEGTLKYFANQRLLGEVPLSGSTALTQFEISANVGGQGVVDFIAVERDVAETGRALSGKVEVVVPPNPTSSSPFDTAVLPNGTVLMAGSAGCLVGVSADGNVERSEYPFGMNFECDRAGVMWYYNFPEGRLYRWDPGKRKQEEIAGLPPAYSDGSIAVAPDGTSVYIGWWLMDKPVSALYRWTAQSGLEKVLERSNESRIRAVEVTADGEVFVGCSDGIYRLRGKATLEPYFIFPKGGFYPASDGLTSDDAGNLYFSAHADGPGVFRLSRNGKLEPIVRFSDDLDLPFGLSWHSATQAILGVRKEKGEMVSIDLRGNVSVLNRPSGLTTPIAIDQHPDGRILINGDEIGLLQVGGGNKVEIYCRGMCCYQPPPADFTFDRDGLIYYTCAAPGFVSEIITIDAKKTIRTLTRDVGSPAGIDTGPDNTVYYADFKRGTVGSLSPQGQSSVIVGNLPFPLGLVVDDSGNIWVGIADSRGQVKPGQLGEVSSTVIAKFDRAGHLLETIRFPESMGIDITFFDVDGSGNLYVPTHGSILRRDPRGKIEVLAEGFNQLRGAKVCSDGYLYFVDYGNPALYRIRIR